MKVVHNLSVILILAALYMLSAGCKTQKTIAKDYGTNLDPGSMDYLKKGCDLFNKKKYDDALLDLNKAIELDAQNGEAFAFRGMVKYQQKNYKGAIEDFDDAIKQIPDYGEVYDLRGIAKAELGNKLDACEDWKKAYELGFNHAFKLIKRFCIVE